MLYKKIIPTSQDFNGLNPILILKISSHGLDKTASMQKRAAAFLKLISLIKPQDGKAYLHVITTGAYETYGSQRNNDSWPLDHMILHPPLAKEASCKLIHTDGGLRKYHNTYLDGAAVYQLHHTDLLKSGIVKAAHYNLDMHRGLLLIEVDVDKWSDRLHKRASGQDIYLSVGAQLPRDICSACGNKAHTLDLHCDHIKKCAGAILLDGTKVCMINDAPKFYDISGVNVPADPLAFVLRKVASGLNAQTVLLNKYLLNQTRPSLGMSKAASILSKLALMLKRIVCKMLDDPMFADSLDDEKEFLHAVENYSPDEVIDQCNNKAILLSPKMLFKLIGKLSDNPLLFDLFADNCNCSCKHLMQDMSYDPLFKSHLSDGSFDTKLPADVSLANVLLGFLSDFGVSRPALNGKAVKITIRMFPGNNTTLLADKLKSSQLIKLDLSNNKLKEDKELKDMLKEAALVGDLFRRTYARYVISFASRNNLDTCQLALQKLARYGTVVSL